MNRTILLCLAVMLAACGRSEPPSEAPGADWVFTNGRVYTVDADRPWAEAVAVTHGRITLVGSNADALALAGTATRVVDLGGRMMMPAFQDGHIHPIQGGVEAAACDLNVAVLGVLASGLAEYAAAIADCAAAKPEAEWITGGGWLMSVFGPGGRPSKRLIDEVVPDRPVYLSSADGHTGWANSRALEIAGITGDTPDPPDGSIDRDPDTGEATGGLQEGAMKLVERHIPPLTLDDRVEGLAYARDMLHRYGITALNDAEVVREELEAYRVLEARGELDLRVVASLKWDTDRGLEQVDDLVALRDAFDHSELVRPTAIKIYQDGVIENYTAALLEPYLLVADGTRGLSMVEPELLKRAVARLDKAGFQVHFHAIGTAAVRQSLDAIEQALNENGPLDHRHHIAHLELIHPDDLPRFAQLATIANFQPLWAYRDSYITDLTVPFIGEERAQWLYPIGSVQKAGGMIAFGSDWSVSTADPMPQIQTAVTRLSAFGEDVPVLLPEERIDLESAIAAFTINAAFLNHLDKATGSIEEGKQADLIVLDRNLFEIDPMEISATKVLLTLFEGRPVHGDLDAL